MANLKFILQYILKPRATGAILPSSRFLARKMVEGIDFANVNCIVEYGPGTGVFTEKVLAARRKNTTILLLERNIDFCQILNAKYKNEKDLHIINDSAENIGKYLSEYGLGQADYIISGLPFASLTQEVSRNILEQTVKFLSHKGCFITFQYTLLKMDFFLQFFSAYTKKREMRNIPPAYVLAFRRASNEIS
ncbi:MAG: SAM-dependent methyltransferase [Defluviitaleaceae bacterium]|nr:SAM-dependent methyltransferase [Defluviitaleaceae bacterium]